MRKLVACPITLRDANAFIAKHHRHHKPARGCIYRIAVVDVTRKDICGVAVVGRPVSRIIQGREPLTCEITRLCTDGTHNACTFLLGAARRVAFVLGYRRIITYTLPSEGGTSLRAAGFWTETDESGQPILVGGGSWSVPSRRRIDSAPLEMKWRWQATA